MPKKELRKHNELNSWYVVKYEMEEEVQKFQQQLKWESHIESNKFTERNNQNTKGESLFSLSPSSFRPGFCCLRDSLGSLWQRFKKKKGKFEYYKRRGEQENEISFRNFNSTK
jgi:hypothetical protein